MSEQAAEVNWQAIAEQRDRELRVLGERKHRVEQERDALRAEVETRTEDLSAAAKVAGSQRSITALLVEMADVVHRLAQASEAHEKLLAGDAVRLAEGDTKPTQGGAR